MKYKGFLSDLNKQRKSFIKKLEQIEIAMAAIAGLSGSAKEKGKRKKPKFSKAARERIAAAQRARWAKIKAAQKK